MSYRQQFRKAASLLLTVALLLWAEAGLAMVPASGHSSQCHANMSGMHQATAATHAMAAGCCPRHVSAKPGCTAHPNFLLAPKHHPDCCTVNSRPSRVEALLVASRASMEFGLQVLTEPDLVLALTAPATRVDESPPFNQSVFDQKTGLRI
jgi:hypothetical protein